MSNPSAKPLLNRYLNHPQGAYRWHKIYDPSICEHIPELYQDGSTDCEVAKEIGIAESTLYTWMKQYPEFKAAVTYGRSLAKAAFSFVGREAALNGRKIDSKIWHIMMRNCHHYDAEFKTSPIEDGYLEQQSSDLEKLEQLKAAHEQPA